MSLAAEHPDYEEECAYLSTVQDRLDQLMGQWSTGSETQSLAYLDTEAAVQLRTLLGPPEALHLIRATPYFARIDFRPDGRTTPQRVYIGREPISAASSQQLVFDWRAPIAQLFYQNCWQQAEYKAPRGVIRGFVSLRRRFKLSHRSLEEIIDETPAQLSDRGTLDHAREASSRNKNVLVDPFLIGVLGESRDGTLRDIVTTIQVEQDRVIRAPKDGIVLVQGAAGSGKTTIALHRLAYLLYTHKGVLSAERALFFGPNPLFFQSIADVLPGLGVEGIKYTTFDKWALDWLNRPVDSARRTPAIECSLSTELVETLLSAPDDRQANIARYRRCRLKGSLHMARVVEAYARQLVGRFTNPNKSAINILYILPQDEQYGYTRPGTSITLTLTREMLSRILQEPGHLSVPNRTPLNEYRQQCITRVHTLLWSQLTAHKDYRDTFRANDPEIRAKRWKHFDKAITPQIRYEMQDWWPQLTPSACYAQLFGDANTLAEAVHQAENISKEGWSADDIALLQIAGGSALGLQAQIRRQKWEREDLPILVLFDVILNGPTQPPLDYVMVDEAQDLSPLQLIILSRMVKNKAMTLVGDVAQGIFSYRGIQSWDEATQALQPTSVNRVNITSSYRATHEITSFANQLLDLPAMRKNGAVRAVPIARNGPVPALQKLETWPQLAEQAVVVATAAIERGAKSAAIICKTDAICRDFFSHLPGDVRSSVRWIQEGASIEPSTLSLIPAYRAKGLEFDCVVVAGADATTYARSEYEIKLLYLALTRALHDLHVFWVGEPTSLLSMDRTHSKAGVTQGTSSRPSLVGTADRARRR